MDSSTSVAVRRGSEEEDGEKMRRDFTEDEIIEILARLPVKSLMRFKCVSKFWYNLILSPNFIAMHTTHNHNKKKVSLWIRSCSSTGGDDRKTTLYFRFGDITDRRQLTFSDADINTVGIVGCFNGVVCLTFRVEVAMGRAGPGWAVFDRALTGLRLRVRPQMYALWNPYTRQVREIGHSPMMDGPGQALFHNDSGFCFDRVTNAFKVAQIKFTGTQGGGETMAQVNVFSTATNSWIEKNMIVPYRTMGSGYNMIHGGTCVNGHMHWHIACSDTYILSYDMIDEVFKRIETPCSPAFARYHLAAYNGSIALFVLRRTGPQRSCSEVDVWVMNDCSGSNQSWYKLLTCRPSITVERTLGFFRKDDVDLILFLEQPNMDSYLYNPENGETTKIFGANSETFLYSETLASIY